MGVQIPEGMGTFEEISGPLNGKPGIFVAGLMFKLCNNS